MPLYGHVIMCMHSAILQLVVKLVLGFITRLVPLYGQMHYSHKCACSYVYETINTDIHHPPFPSSHTPEHIHYTHTSLPPTTATPSPSMSGDTTAGGGDEAEGGGVGGVTADAITNGVLEGKEGSRGVVGGGLGIGRRRGPLGVDVSISRVKRVFLNFEKVCKARGERDTERDNPHPQRHTTPLFSFSHTRIFGNGSLC